MSYNNFTYLPHDYNGYSIKYDLDQEVVGEGIYVRFNRNNSWRQCWTILYRIEIFYKFFLVQMLQKLR